MSGPAAYVDLAKLDEDGRINVIGDTVMKLGQVNAFVVEDRPKAKRYIRKLQERYPGIVVLKQFKLAGQIAVKVGPPPVEHN